MKRRFILVKESKILHKVFVDEIVYIEAFKDYAVLFSSAPLHRKYIVHSTMLEMEQKFPEFIRISRSHIINPEQINRVEDFHYIYVGSTSLPIGGVYREKFKEEIKKWRI